MDNSLYHHGVVGMKWGIRRSKSSNINSKDVYIKGESVKLTYSEDPKTAKFLARILPKVKENIERYDEFYITNKVGKRVGNVTIRKDDNKEMNLVWIGVNHKENGKGYGQSAMRTIIKYAKKNKYKKITLEVPSNSPNARHIYEKQGFKVSSEKIIGSESDYWGGLTSMELSL